LAVARLSESAEIPGLQAIELVLLALPWSLVLGVVPFSLVNPSGMTTIIAAGVVLNGLALRSIARVFKRRRIRPSV